MEQQKTNSRINRRLLLKGLGLGAASAALALQGNTAKAWDGNLKRVKIADEFQQAINDSEALTITKVEGIKFSDKINIGGGSGGDGKAEFCWVRISTNKGIV